MTFSFNARFWKLFAIFVVASFAIGFLAGVIWRCVPMFVFLFKIMIGN